MNTEELYKALKGKTNSKKAKATLLQANWFTVNAVFDPRSGSALPQTLSGFLQKLVQPVSDEGNLCLHDRLWRITEHARGAFEHLAHSLNENPQREHALLPIRAVRELDAASFIKLSQRPGRNIREKLSEKPYLQAVRRFQSVDLPENRLLKAFAIRMQELLNIRKEYLGRAGLDPLLATIDNWLKSDEALYISRWDNLPPNNTLLSHRDYRRIWDAWTWLQSLDERIEKDYSEVELREKNILFWHRLAQYRFAPNICMSEIPLLFDYDNFSITTWQNAGIFIKQSNAQYKIKVNNDLPEIAVKKTYLPQPTVIEEPVCVDLSSVCPKYSTGSEVRQAIKQFVWQQWSTKQDRFDFIALNSSALVEDDSVKTVIPEAFFSIQDGCDKDFVEQATFAFVCEWHKFFRNEALIWLVPDILSDFEMETIRRNINSVFDEAQPLPRSIAAAYQFVNLSERKSGFPVVVIDRFGGMIYATKLIAKFDPKLKEAAPETKGYAWERYPAKLIDSYDERTQEYNSVSFQGVWHLKKKNAVTTSQYNESLKTDPEFGNAYYINLTKDRTPVIGGIKLYAMQQQSGEIPLWYDHLPELSTRIGLNTEFYFVKKAKIAPQRDRAVRIPIVDRFLLPAHTSRYEFPLFKGSGASKIKYKAVLTSRDFPLSEAVQCSLEMFYTYGADNPYSLYFVPENAPSKKYAVQWMASDDNIDIETLPIPLFPTSHCWNDYYRWPRKDGDGVSDLFDWTREKIKQLGEHTHSPKEYSAEINNKKTEALAKIQELELEKDDILRKLQRATISSPVKQDKNNNSYCFSRLDDGQSVFIPPQCLNEKIDATSICIGREVWVCTKPGKSGSQSLIATYFSFKNVLPSFLRGALDTIESKKEKIKIRADRLTIEQLIISDQKISANILRGMQYPIGTLWSGGRSLSDSDVPEDFRNLIFKWLEYIRKSLAADVIYPEFKTEILYLCCCMHQDCPPDIIQHFANLNDDDFIKSRRNIAMLIGAGKLPWQKLMLERLIKQIPQNKYLLLDLTNILWRTESIIFSITDKDCNLICNTLQESLDGLIIQLQTKYPPDSHVIEQFMTSKRVSKDIAVKILKGKYVRPIVINLEILLALLRLRKQEGLELARNLLPNERVNLSFLNQLRCLSQLLIEKKLTLKTRLAMNVSKPTAFKEMPDLLYAVYMYLTGDSGANTICINSVDDQDEEQED